VAFGTRRDRYQGAQEMQCYSGIAPVTQASGDSEWVPFCLPQISAPDVSRVCGLLDRTIGVG
jgi:hypothetical protein